MRFLSSIVLGLSTCLSSLAQNNPHPLKDLTNLPTRAAEFVVLHSTNVVGGSSPLVSTLGQYDVGQQNPSQRAVRKDSYDSLGVAIANRRSINVHCLDLNGDSYDEVLEVHELDQGWGIGLLNTTKNPLKTTGVQLDTILNGMPSGLRSPVLKMASGDFKDDGSSELVVAYRDYSTEKVAIEIRAIDPNSAAMTILARMAIDSFYTVGSTIFEVFDVAVGDFNGDQQIEIAVAALEPTAPNQMGVYLRLYKVITGPIVSHGWSLLPAAVLSVTNLGDLYSRKYLSLDAGHYDSTMAQDLLALAVSYRDPGNFNLLRRQLFLAASDSGSTGLDSLSLSATPYSMDFSNPQDDHIVDMVSGDLNGDSEEELVLAFNNHIYLFSPRANLIPVLRTTTTGSSPVANIYDFANNANYLAINDFDFDFRNELLYVTINDDGFYTQWLEAWFYELDDSLQSISSAGGSGSFLTNSYKGNGGQYHFALASGELSGGTVVIKEPRHVRRQLLRPLIINNAPPHHFDLLDSTVADITNCFPNFNCNMNSEYKAVNTSSSTLSATLKSDWSVSNKLSGGGSLYGVKLEASLSQKYGEEFANTQLATSTVEISTLSTASGDDQIYASITEYDVFEYPVDSSGVVVGHIVALIKVGAPIIQWMDSKSTDALSYFPDHEVGNLLSYPSSANFASLSRITDTIKEGVGYNVGSGGSLNFSMVFTDFSSSQVDITKSWGVELSATAGFMDYASVEVSGEYNQSELISHTSTASSEIAYTSNLTTSLNPAYSDANYTITPYVFWSRNGAVNLGYAVDPSIPSGGTNNFWSDHYLNKVDLSLIMPWKWDPEKGYSLGSTPDKRRLTKSLRVNKLTFTQGDTVSIVASIHNYSLKDFQGPLELQFYSGQPESAGVLLADINGQSTMLINDTIEAQGRTIVQFEWLVGSGVNATTNVYVVIDPNDLVPEIHEDNNIGFFPMGNSQVALPEHERNHPLSELALYPNPLSAGPCQLNLRLAMAGELEVKLYSLSGQMINLAYRGNLRRGNYILPLQLYDLANGHFLVEVSLNGHAESLQLVIQRP